MTTTIETCTHRTRHQHGTATGYRCGCRDECCTSAHRREDKRRRLAALAGRPTTIDGALVRAHIARLTATGMTVRQIAAAVGIHASALDNLIHGRTRRIHRDTAAKVLAVRLAVTPTGVRRRMQALAAVGWRTVDLADQLGLCRRSAVHLLCDPPGRVVYPSTAARVAALYETAWRGPDTPDPRAIAHARRKGCAAPLAWDDDTIDDPAATPQGIPGAPVAYRWGQTRDTIRDLLDLGETRDAIAMRLGITRDAVDTSLRRAAA